jgi:CRISPR-associated protein Csm1
VDQQKEQLFLGALLHDIGKFVIRARQSGEGKDHSELGEEWLLQYKEKLPPGIAHFARLHHARYFSEIRETNLTLLVYHADNLSAAGDRLDKEGVFDHRGTPLASIFSRISLSGDSAEQQYFLPLKPLGREILFPLPRDQIDMGDEAYDGLLQLFTLDFVKWLDMGRPLGCLALLLEKYWSTIPSETKRVWKDEKTFPDISLYDHTKTTAAFALALYEYFRETGSGTLERLIIPELDCTWLNQGKRYFRIVAGDFSGVQRM